MFRKTRHFVHYEFLLLNFFWWYFIKTGNACRRKNLMFCWNMYSTDVLSSWIFLTPSFEVSHLPSAHLYCEVYIYKFLCSSRWEVLCLHKSSFYIYCHPLTFSNLTWKLFMCMRKQVKILIISPYKSKETWNIWQLLKD